MAVLQILQRETARGRANRRSVAMARFVLGQPGEVEDMTIGTLLLILIVLALIGAVPAWPYSRSWGYAPSGVVGVLLLVVVVLLVSGRI